MTRAGIERSKFNLSHTKKFDAGFGNLIPVLVQEILPGDKFRISTDVVLRFAPLVSPVMHEVDAFLHYFFVPNRLLFDEWEDFITLGSDGISNVVAPYYNMDGFGNWFGYYTLSDYLGLPVDGYSQSQSVQVSVLPFNAYWLIWNEWYRQQDWQAELDIDTSSGLHTYPSALISPLTRNYPRDFFNVLLPTAQKGPPVSVDLATLAPVTGIGKLTPAYLNTDQVVLQTGSLDPVLYPYASAISASSEDTLFYIRGTEYTEGYPDIYADIGASSVSIEQLRTAFQLQVFAEINARCGSRYTEYVLAHFGQSSPDSRLQRPEYLGGVRAPVAISEVLQTSSTDDTSPQGHMTGHGFSAASSRPIRRHSTEHGFIIGLFSVVPKPAYNRMINFHWFRSQPYYYGIPSLAHLGERAVVRARLSLPSDSSQVNAVIGYNPIYEEYRRGFSTVSGDFRNPTGLGTWHMGFLHTGSDIVNVSDILPCRPATYSRVFAAGSTVINSQYRCWISFNISAVRCLPRRGTPKSLY